MVPIVPWCGIFIFLKNTVGAWGQGRWEEEEGEQEEEEEDEEDNGEGEKEGEGEDKDEYCSSMRRSALCCCKKRPVHRCLVSCGNARLRALCCCRKLSIQSSSMPTITLVLAVVACTKPLRWHILFER